jgi:hypothetical protein
MGSTVAAYILLQVSIALHTILDSIKTECLNECGFQAPVRLVPFDNNPR